MKDAELIRSVIREVLAEELAAIRGGGPQAETVRIAGDGCLAAFARRVLQLAEDPATRRLIEDGRYPFRLERAAEPARSGDSTRIERGVVTEKSVDGLPKGIRRVLLAKGVNVTPLARERARRLGISIERIGP
jgi:hypothetical protein